MYSKIRSYRKGLVCLLAVSLSATTFKKALDFQGLFCFLDTNMSFSIPSLARSELIIKKSRFLGCVQPVNSREEAQQIVMALRADHPGAAHVCWALLAGGQSAAVDDGEPSGTAGRPMLDVLRHQQLEGVLATVVRYYGGVKLGAGGLVRAYTDAVAQALLTVPKIPRIRKVPRRCLCDYALEGMVRREVSHAGATLLHVAHEHVVTLAFQIAEADLVALETRLNELSQGRVVWMAD